MLATFLNSFKITGSAVIEILLLGLCGFILVRKNILTLTGLEAISKFVIEVTVPLFVFTQLLSRFSFSLYPNWFIFPVISFLISLCGFIIAYLLLKLNKNILFQRGFVSLVAFQNSGYLVIPLVVALLPKERADILLIYVFLFLLGFNILIWSLGVYMLSNERRKKFELGSLFSPVVVAILVGFLFIFLKIDKIMPSILIRPFKLIGECTIPLAMLVVGGNLALIDFSKTISLSSLFSLILAKLILLPLIGLFIVYSFKPAPLIGLLIIIQTAVPSATSLSVISRHYKIEDADFIAQGIFWTHLLSIFTIPVFLSLFSLISAF
jgi:hypothetical protein